MAKELYNIKITLTDSVSGGAEPDTASVQYVIKDSVDTELTKVKNYNVESPNFSQTVDEFWATEKAAIKSTEGIS